MEFYRYLNILRKYLSIIVFLILLGGVSAYGFSRRQPKVYKATATLSINAAAPAPIVPYIGSSLTNATGVAPVDQLVTTYGIFLKSLSFDRTIIQRLRLRITPAQLSKQISSTSIPNTNYLEIGVTWNDAQQAANVANGIADIFIRDNAAQLRATRQTGSGAQFAQSLNYFRHQIVVVQGQYSKLAANPRSNQSTVSALEARLNQLSDTYYQLLGTASTTVQPSTSMSSAALSDAAVAPTTSTSSQTATSVLLGILSGLIVGLGLALLLDFLVLQRDVRRSRIKGTGDTGYARHGEG